ncbi:MAG: hypothetical protein J2P21_20185 [Chloracidobacterium sp.]|nr:hypothetical protein [Chloracidobacterium sp.]
MKVLLSALMSALFITSACRAQSRQASDQSKISNEEYAVYSAVIRNMFAGDRVTFDTQAKVKMLVIEDRTVSESFNAAAGENETERLKQIFSPTIPQEIIDDFVAKNAKSCQLTNSLDIKLKYTIIPKEKIKPITGLPSDEFYKQFPDSGGYIALSRVGLNANGDQALAYMQHVCGGLCGSGHYLLLAKNNGGWVVQESFRAWIS